MSREILGAAAFSSAIVLAAWGSRKVVHDLRALMPMLRQLLPDRDEDPATLFLGIGSTLVPIAMTTASTAVFATQALLEEGWVEAIVAGFVSLLIGAVAWTFFWVYLGLQVGLDRLGRRRLLLDTNSGDPDLGLRSIGRLAFSAFWILLAALVPLALVSVAEPVGLAMTLVSLVAGVAAFFLSQIRLHRQMAAAKWEQLEWARRLYRDVLTPLRAEESIDTIIDTIRVHADALRAVEAIHTRAEKIHQWPFDEGTLTQVLFIASTAVAAIVARVVLAPLGF